MRRTTALAFCLILAAVAGVPLASGVAKPPKPGPLTLTAARPAITFGQSDTLSGQLKGAGAGVRVQLQQQPAPYVTGFKPVPGATATTDSQGRFSFTVRPALNTRYKAVAKAKPTVTSNQLTLPVRFKVTLRLSDYTPARGQRVRFFGITAPAHDGGIVYIQRRTATGRYRTVSRAVLRHASGNFSTYSKRIRIRRSGVFRSRVLGNGLNATGTSHTRRERVH